MTSLRLIAKPEPGEYPAYTEMYMSFLPDDGKVLQLLQSKFYTINNFIYVLPVHRLLHQNTPENGALKKHWYTLLIRNGYVRTAH